MRKNDFYIFLFIDLDLGL